MNLNWITDIRWVLASELPKSRTSSKTGEDKTNTPPQQGLIEQIQVSLEKTQLDAQMQTSLQEKFDLLNASVLSAEESQMNHAGKDTITSTIIIKSDDPEFTSGIISGSSVAGLPHNMRDNNTWQTRFT